MRPLTPREASDYLRERGVSRTATTLAKLRTVGNGPPFRKAGKRNIIYEQADLDAYAESLFSGPYYSTGDYKKDA